MKTIGIVGAGALGSYYGCRMVEAGQEVRFLLRSDYEEVCRQGFEIKSRDGDFVVREPFVFNNSDEMGPVDLVVVAWKATANEYAKEVIGPLLHEGTKILTLQNGLGNVEFFENLFGRGRILGALCFVGVNRLAAGRISHTVGGMITVGESVETGVLDQMSTLFGERVEVKLTSDLALAQWNKLIWNIPFNGLCVTEGGIDTEELLARSGMSELVLGIMREVQQVARALGHQIEDSFLEGQLERTLQMGRYKPSSMLDYVNGLPLEVEAIWGKPVQAAEEVGVEVPHLRKLQGELARLDRER